ncbi:MAG: recombinase family protein [Thaumarchaeota archaeon]|nr:recombinase family protein [Nitrososphaerota archaeon]
MGFVVTSGSGLIAARMDPVVSRISAAYMRVSTEDQNLDLQETLLKDQKPDRIYSDQDSGMNVARTEYLKLCEDIQGDSIREVTVYRLDRLGRDPRELIRFFDLLELHQVKFISLTEPWLTRWNQGPMEFQMWWMQLGMARFELLLLKDRQKRGIAAARARGQHMGRPRKKR